MRGAALRTQKLKQEREALLREGTTRGAAPERANHPHKQVQTQTNRPQPEPQPSTSTETRPQQKASFPPTPFTTRHLETITPSDADTVTLRPEWEIWKWEPAVPFKKSVNVGVPRLTMPSSQSPPSASLATTISYTLVRRPPSPPRHGSHPRVREPSHHLLLVQSYSPRKFRTSRTERKAYSCCLNYYNQ